MDIKLSSLAKFGTPIIFGILILLIGLSWFIKYPDIITTNAKLTSTDFPKPIVSKINGRLEKLMVSNGDEINEGQIIGSLESIADLNEVLAFSVKIDSICSFLVKQKFEKIEPLMHGEFENLGELQASYQSFIKDYIPFKDYLIGGYSDSKIKLIKSDEKILSKFSGLVNERTVLIEKDLEIHNKILDNNRELLKDQIISQQEFDKLNSENILKKSDLPNLKHSNLENERQKITKEDQILEIKKERNNQTVLFLQAALNFKNLIDEWKKKYLLIASVSGKVSFTNFLQENEQIEAGQIIGYIIPPNTSYYLNSIVPQVNFGKVEIGQKVLLKFSSFPWNEYGTVKGKIAYISPLASDSGYLIKINLPEGLKTNYGNILTIKQGSVADANIITKDLRVLERFYYSILKKVN